MHQCVTGGSPRVLLSCINMLLSLGLHKLVYVVITFLLFLTHFPACFLLLVTCSLEVGSASSRRNSGPLRQTPVSCSVSS